MWQQLGLPGSEVRALPARFVVGVVVPSILFYVGVRQGTLTVALLAAGGWTLGLQFYELVRRRTVDPFLVYGFAFTVAQGAVALYARSPAVFAGGGIVENLLAGLALLGSIAVCRPLLVEVVSAAIRGRAVLTLPVRGVLGRLTVAWALLLLARSVGLYAALIHLTIGQFLVVNTLAGWPLNGVGLLLSVAYLRVQLSRVFPGHASKSCAGLRLRRSAV